MSGNIHEPVTSDTEAHDKKSRWYIPRWRQDTRPSQDEATPLLGGNREQTPLAQFLLGMRLGFLAMFSIIACQLGFRYVQWLCGSWRPSEFPMEKAERIIMDTPNPYLIRDYLEHYTSESHLAGTESDRLQAEWTRDKLLEFGIPSVKIEKYWPLINYPKKHRVAIVSGPSHLLYEAKLREDVAKGDKTSKQQDDVPTFHGYSKAGNVTAPIVYVNYGRIEDFRLLASRGVQLNGTIALVRYGRNFRGLKVTAAEQFGCVGTLIYSDPIDDGPLAPSINDSPAKPYPDGPWRSASSVQRGSVQPFSLMAGDPLTPGYAATEDAPRLEINETIGIAKIPSMPISWEDAAPLFKALLGRGQVIDGWSGGISNISYFYGPSIAQVNLVNEIENKITPVWNVIGKIKGREEDDRVIVLGKCYARIKLAVPSNHRDAWVFGAIDPSSGSAIMLEIARTLGILLKEGWRPRRTIILASWDAEEYGMVGSTEWVEDHRKWLSREALCYLNVDMAVYGPVFAASGSPSLNRVLFDVTKRVKDPNSKLSVYDAWLNSTGGNAKRPAVGVLGSGSDYVSFIDHVGIASMDIRFIGDEGVYHSNYDSLYWMDHFGDPTYQYHVALGQIWGLMALHLSSDRVLNMRATPYADAIAEYYSDLKQLVYPSSFPTLEKAIQMFTDAAELLDAEAVVAKAKYEKAGKINDRLAFFERWFIDSEGIKGREWFKHVLIAPGLWTGYAAQTFPAIVEAIDTGNNTAVVHTVERAAMHIEKAAKWMAGKK